MTRDRKERATNAPCAQTGGGFECFLDLTETTRQGQFQGISRTALRDSVTSIMNDSPTLLNLGEIYAWTTAKVLALSRCC